MIDYSKWEKLEMSSSDEEGDDKTPHVTHFEKPQSVTIGEEALEWQQPNESHQTKQLNECSTTSASRTVSSCSILDFAKATRNGNSTDWYLWSQTKDSITIHIMVDLDVTGKDIRFNIQNDNISQSLSENFDNPMTTWPSSFEESNGRLLKLDIQHHGTLKQIQETLAFPVKGNDESIIWELKTFSSIINVSSSQITFQESKPIRCIVIFLTKSVPIIGATIWWNRLFETEPCIDISCFPDRQISKHQSFKAAWDEAHNIFVEKMRQEKGLDKRTPI